MEEKLFTWYYLKKKETGGNYELGRGFKEWKIRWKNENGKNFKENGTYGLGNSEGGSGEGF